MPTALTRLTFVVTKEMDTLLAKAIEETGGG